MTDTASGLREYWGLAPINIDRLWSRVLALAKLTQSDLPYTRRAFSAEFLRSRDWLVAQMVAAGMSTSVDAAGNLVGRHAGRSPGLKPIRTGSHCDTVVGGGRFDGIVGVLAGIEVAHTIHERGFELDHPFEVIDFLSEEPGDHGVSCVGSRGFCGMLDATMLAATNDHGDSLADAIGRAGGDPARLSAPLHGAGSTAAFVELHIELGPVLEARRLPIGVVTHIVGVRRYAVTVHGRADHAGTMPMDMRRDALLGAARVVEAVHVLARQLSGGPDHLVATIGRMTVSPNAGNVVPARADMTLEVRSDNDELLRTFAARALDRVRRDLAEQGLRLIASPTSHEAPTRCTSFMIDLIEQAAQSQGCPSLRMASGASHDAAYVARTGPMGMIFIPCLHGRGHCAEESVNPEQLLDGARVLYETVLRLDVLLQQPSRR